ncbi:MAG: ABC transporter permease subunit [Oscillospiraceae bacterium]|nr:ABC transporter permease subunit [Oscillospiraceae bacterium]
MHNQETKAFSGVLFGYTVRTNLPLMLVITLVFCLFTAATNLAASMLVSDAGNPADKETQKMFFTYLGALAAYDEMTGSALSYEDFLADDAAESYDSVFSLYNANQPEDSAQLSREGFLAVIDRIRQTDTRPETLVRTFEYQYALAGRTGVFTAEPLSLADMVDTMLEEMGISAEDLEQMQDMDLSSMINRVYYTAMGALVQFLFVIIAANALIASQVDRGSMAYLLSAPNRRSAVAVTQLIYLVLAPLVILSIGCIVRIVSTKVLFGEVCVPRLLCLFLGLYILVEAIAGICYLGSCIFNESAKSLAFGGGIAVWCFLASLLGMFGSEELVAMGIGVDVLGVFNKLTLISLFDISRIQTIGTEAPDLGFLWKLAVLGIIAIVTYTAGAIRFSRKDLPL